MANRVVHVKDNVPDAIYIGRAVSRIGLPGSKWGNPFVIGEHGDRDQVVSQYAGYFLMSGLVAELPELRDKTLACWCRHDGEKRTDDNTCHGDILTTFLEVYPDEVLRQMSGDDLVMSEKLKEQEATIERFRELVRLYDEEGVTDQQDEDAWGLVLSRLTDARAAITAKDMGIEQEEAS